MPPPIDRPRAAYMNALLTALALRLAVLFVLAGWEFLVPTPPHPNRLHYVGETPVLSLWGQLFVKWDSYWYLDIAQHGYRSASQTLPHSNAAFAPLYPWLMAAGARIGLDPWIAGLLISLIAYLLSLHFLYRLGESTGDARLGRALMLWVSVFPSAWVLTMVFSESLFCLALAGFFLSYHRGRYGTAAIWAAIVPLIRVAGLALSVAIAIDVAWRMIRSRRIDERWPLPAGSVLGVALLMTSYIAAGAAPLAFIQAGAEWSTRSELVGHIAPLLWSFARHFADRPEAALYALFFVVYAAACAWSIARRPGVGSWFSGLYLLIILQMPLHCQMRYLLPLIPLHVVLIERVAKHRSFATVAVVTSIILQIILARLGLAWRIVL